MSSKAELVQFLGSLTHDPVGFVRACFPWGEGELSNYKGPDKWQLSVLDKVAKGLMNIADVIRIATASGNGIG